MSETVAKTLRDQSVTFTVSAADIAKLRRMVNESGTATYTDAMLADYIVQRWQPDDRGREPTDASWVTGYDLNGAACDIWAEKASALEAKFDFTADDGTFNRSQLIAHCFKLAKHYKARSAPRPIVLMQDGRAETPIEYWDNVMQQEE